MDLTQIRYFLALARELNFTRAADACNVTQPALTKSIQRLEAELGGPLLLRERSLTQLTELGRTMLPLLEQTSRAAEAAKAQAASFRQPKRQLLRIGLGPQVPACLFGPLLRAVNARFGTLELTITHGAPEALNDALLHQELDVAVLDGADALADRVNRWPLFQDDLHVLMPEGHALASAEAVQAADLQGHSLVLRDAAVSRALGRLRAGLGLDLPPRHLGGDDDAVHQLVLAGLGLGLAIGRRLPPPGLALRPLAPVLARHEVVVAVVAGRPLARAADAFVRLARARDWEMPAAA